MEKLYFEGLEIALEYLNLHDSADPASRNRAFEKAMSWSEEYFDGPHFLDVSREPAKLFKLPCHIPRDADRSQGDASELPPEEEPDTSDPDLEPFPCFMEPTLGAPDDLERMLPQIGNRRDTEEALVKAKDLRNTLILTHLPEFLAQLAIIGVEIAKKDPEEPVSHRTRSRTVPRTTSLFTGSPAGATKMDSDIQAPAKHDAEHTLPTPLSTAAPSPCGSSRGTLDVPNQKKKIIIKLRVPKHMRKRKTNKACRVPQGAEELPCQAKVVVNIPRKRCLEEDARFETDLASKPVPKKLRKA